MPTEVIVTVKASGGDYTTLIAAEAGQQGDLVSQDKKVTIKFFRTNYNSRVVIDGSTTDATRYMEFVADESVRHVGVYDTAKAGLVSGSYTNLIEILDNYVVIDGFLISNTYDGGDGIVLSGVTGVQIKNCIVKLGNNFNDGSCIHIYNSPNTSVYNCVLYNSKAQGLYSSGTSTTIVSNSVSVNNGTGFVRPTGSSTLTLKNCYAGGNTTAPYSGTITLISCAHNTATVISGSTASIAWSTANFVNVTTATLDVHLQPDASSTLISGGTDLSSSFTTDFEGDTITNWHIGVDTIVVEGGGGGGDAVGGGVFSSLMIINSNLNNKQGDGVLGVFANGSYIQYNSNDTSQPIAMTGVLDTRFNHKRYYW
jgi:hypothetical protein